MRPVLFELGPLEVRSYGVFVALAFVGAWLVLRHELARRAGRGDAASGLIFAAGLGGLVGARLYWLVENTDSAHSGDVFSGAGLTWYGGVLGGGLAVLLAARRAGVRVPDLLGAAAPGLAMGYALGRIACQFRRGWHLRGAQRLAVGDVLPPWRGADDRPRPPTPVYETLTGLLVFGLLWRLRDRLPAMRLFGLYLVLAGAERFLVEFIRRNDEVVAGLTQPQLFAAAFVVGGAVLLGWRTKPGRRWPTGAGAEPQASPPAYYEP